ncbi:MAG: NFACT family protein [bacterium]|nr:NFACT family protein [bacterium]MDT8364906.1 NFACT family protein [bacterium]
MDYLSLKAAVREAEKRFAGQKIFDAWQAGPGEVILVTRSGSGLLFSINPDRPGLFLADPGERPDRVFSPFNDLLRVRIKGTSVGSIYLQKAGERIVTLTFAAAWPAREGTPLKMVLEIMGRRSNLLILAEERILVPLKAVPKDKSPARPVMAGEPYRPPPPREGTPVEEVTTEALPMINSREVGKTLLENIQGLSPYTANQAVQLALQKRPKEDRSDNREGITITIREMVASCTGEKGFLLGSNGKFYLSPFQPVPLGPSDTVEEFSPFSLAAAAWMSSDPSYTREGHSEPGYLKRGLEDRLERIRSALQRVDTEEERCRTHDEIRIMAEALLINAVGIDHGIESVLLPDPYNPGLELTIPMDRTKTPHENANDLFSKARRLKRGLEETRSRRGKLDEELKEIRQAMEALDDKNDPGPARELLSVGTSVTVKKGKVSHTSYSGPGHRHMLDGFTILVGKSSTDNEKVTFKAAGPNDLWLHARDFPGSHVVILTEKRQVPDKVLYTAAALAAKGSGARNDTAPEIMVTERKWVRKLKGAKPGMVTVERFRTIRPRM